MQQPTSDTLDTLGASALCLGSAMCRLGSKVEPLNASIVAEKAKGLITERFLESRGARNRRSIRADSRKVVASVLYVLETHHSCLVRRLAKCGRLNRFGEYFGE